jgi:hypothetical protein
MMKTENLNLVQEWDKTFPKSEKVDHSKVTFVNYHTWGKGAFLLYGKGCLCRNDEGQQVHG